MRKALRSTKKTPPHQKNASKPQNNAATRHRSSRSSSRRNKTETPLRHRTTQKGHCFFARRPQDRVETTPQLSKPDREAETETLKKRAQKRTDTDPTLTRPPSSPSPAAASPPPLSSSLQSSLLLSSRLLWLLWRRD